ncbi:MAG: ABC transporter permease subunit [Clostridia bacterium]|nr:ABC transporter permease subunit [Clostridia bacterium]
MVKSKLRDTMAFCLGIVLIGAALQAAGAIKGDDLVFPGVDVILSAFLRIITTGKTWLMIRTTMAHLIASVAVSTALGVCLGLAMGMLPFLRQLMKPMMIMLRSLPMIILIVIIMVLADYSHVPVLASSIILVPMIAEAACEGCVRIDRELIDVYRMNANFNGRVLLQVYLPLMAGYLKQAWVNAVGMGVKLAVSTEYLVQTKNSLGKAVHSSAYFNEYQDIYAYALVMILLVLAVSETPVWVMNALGRWKAKRMEQEHP